MGSPGDTTEEERLGITPRMSPSPDFAVKIAMDLKLRLAAMLHIGAIGRWKRLKSRRKCLVGWDNCRSSETLIPHPIHEILVLPR